MSAAAARPGRRAQAGPAGAPGQRRQRTCGGGGGGGGVGGGGGGGGGLNSRRGRVSRRGALPCRSEVERIIMSLLSSLCDNNHVMSTIITES